MENSPIIMAICQVIILIAQAVTYLRSKQDISRVDKELVQQGMNSRNALDTATQAKRDVETIEIQHYKALLVKYEGVILELVDAQRKIKSLQGDIETLRESIASCNNKLASRDRSDKLSARRAEKEDQEKPTSSGELGVDDLARMGLAMPLAPNGAPVQEVRSSFGRTFKGAR